jgi:hypothetical protein
MDYIIIHCPNCKDFIYIHKTELNCHIFRHGIYKNNYKQMNPHLNKMECDRLVNNQLIYGCGKPFKIIYINNEYISIHCDYI